MQRRTLVTGAASGIGRERGTARTRRAPGPRCRSASRLGRAGRAVRSRSGDARGNAAAVEAALERFGGLDAVVAKRASSMSRRSRSSPTSAGTACSQCSDKSVPAGQARLDGARRVRRRRFLAVASVHGLVASPYKAGYVAAKHGLLGLVKVLALEGAERGISVSALCPGYVRTPIVESQIEAQARATVSHRSVCSKTCSSRRRRSSACWNRTEVAETAAFLLGPGGRAFTGAPVVMDLGWTAR